MTNGRTMRFDSGLQNNCFVKNPRREFVLFAKNAPDLEKSGSKSVNKSKPLN